MSEEPEKKQEPPQIIVTSPKDQVQTLIDAGELAEGAVSFNRQKSKTYIFINKGDDQTTNPTLAAYLHRAERKIVDNMMPEIIEKARKMITEELTNIKELLR